MIDRKVVMTVVEHRNIPNGVVHMVKISVTNSAQGVTLDLDLADEMIKRGYGSPIGQRESDNESQFAMII